LIKFEKAPSLTYMFKDYQKEMNSQYLNTEP